MKVKYLLLFYISAIPIYSQQFTIGISGGIDLLNGTFTNNKDYLNSYWHKGINLNLTGEYFVLSRVSLNSIIEYVFYKYDHYSFDEIHFPETGLISASGKNSKAIRIFENIKLYANLNRTLQYYFATGIGYILEDLGTITAKFDDLNYGQSISKLRYEGRHNFVHNLEIGIRIKFIQNLAIDVSGTLYSNYINILNHYCPRYDRVKICNYIINKVL